MVGRVELAHVLSRCSPVVKSELLHQPQTPLKSTNVIRGIRRVLPWQPSHFHGVPAGLAGLAAEVAVWVHPEVGGSRRALWRDYSSGAVSEPSRSPGLLTHIYAHTRARTQLINNHISPAGLWVRFCLSLCICVCVCCAEMCGFSRPLLLYNLFQLLPAAEAVKPHFILQTHTSIPTMSEEDIRLVLTTALNPWMQGPRHQACKKGTCPQENIQFIHQWVTCGRWRHDGRVQRGVSPHSAVNSARPTRPPRHEKLEQLLF